MNKSFVFITLSALVALAACTVDPDGTNTDTIITTTTSHTTSSSHSGGSGGAGGDASGGGGSGGQGGATNALNCDNVPDLTFVAKFRLEGAKPEGEDYLAADGFQFGDEAGTWPRKYLGTDPDAMSAEINFGLVGPTWFVQLSWGLASNPDPNKPGMAADFWVCDSAGPDWGCGVDLTRSYLGCYGHTVVNPVGGGAVVTYAIQ